MTSLKFNFKSKKNCIKYLSLDEGDVGWNPGSRTTPGGTRYQRILQAEYFSTHGFNPQESKYNSGRLMNGLVANIREERKTSIISIFNNKNLTTKCRINEQEIGKINLFLQLFVN